MNIKTITKALNNMWNKTESGVEATVETAGETIKTATENVFNGSDKYMKMRNELDTSGVFSHNGAVNHALDNSENVINDYSKNMKPLQDLSEEQRNNVENAFKTIDDFEQGRDVNTSFMDTVLGNKKSSGAVASGAGLGLVLNLSRSNGQLTNKQLYGVDSLDE